MSLETKAERLEYLDRLVEAGEKACRDAYDNRRSEPLKSASVNWADLHCVSAEYRLENDGHEYFAVHIEEAAPGCEADSLASYIAEHLSKAGFVDVYVHTEW